MIPTYEELVELNPLLARRTREQVQVLLVEIESCGYRWDPERKVFFNEQMGVHVRTQGLDLFEPGEFAHSTSNIARNIQENPWGTFLRRKWSSVAPKIVYVFLVWLLLGWLFGWKIWLIVLASLLVCLFLFYAVCSFVWHGRLM